MSNRATLIKNIHSVAYGRLKLDEATYRTIVLAANDREKTSCTDLTDHELELVLVALRRLSGSRAAARSNEPQHKMIPHLMEYLGWSWQQTSKLCKRLTGWDNTRKCSAAELRKVITAMCSIIRQEHTAGRLRLSSAQQNDFERYTGYILE